MRFTFLLAAGLAVLAGCDSGPPTGDVAGTVSYQGVPIADGTINFFPVDGKGTSAGGPIKDGNYDVKKVPAGNMLVQITSSKVVGKKKMYNTPDSPEMPLTKDFLPAKYNHPLNSELRFEVQPGKNDKNWDLK